MAIASPLEIIADIRAGRMVILVDDEDRENEGDLIMAADFVNADAINFMAKEGRGLICLTLTRERCEQLQLPLMVERNGAAHGTNFTLSIEAADGVTTGISAADRARTVQAAVAKQAKPNDIVQPGHIFPLMAQEGGVLMRAGHTEAGCDLARLAGLTPAAVICEIMNDDGSMARLPDLIEFAKRFDLKIGTIADLIQYRSATECMVERVCERRLKTNEGEFNTILYRDKPTGEAHIALFCGDIEADKPVMIRVHEPLSIMDILEVGRVTHTWTVPAALKEIAKTQYGIVVLLNCGQSAEDLFAEFSVSDQSLERAARKSKNDLRNYGIGAQILKDLGARKIRVLGSPRKIPSMATGYDLEVLEYLKFGR
ncbi:bifunctional 3,4-dihydroxy-2-butanone-4-phosphate synthase/GTP cyclohydrolase II [Ampullimonas aquatilis]|uniref:bifunctional 3,4-dihydroxy-2-butanone-4-phosphate synthase/GTP cyclohydrolase II n=1 Tax=Ampullimonas aquatilis TaxID=1341549 RepID=UPI003C722A78